MMQNKMYIKTPIIIQETNISNAFTELLESENLLQIFTKDGNLSLINKSLMRFTSTLVNRILNDVPCCSSSSSMIFIPDVSKSSLDHVLSIIVSGFSDFNSVSIKHIQDVQDTAKMLQIDLSDLDFVEKRALSESIPEHHTSYVSPATDDGNLGEVSDLIEPFEYSEIRDGNGLSPFKAEQTETSLNNNNDYNVEREDNSKYDKKRKLCDFNMNLPDDGVDQESLENNLSFEDDIDKIINSDARNEFNMSIEYNENTEEIELTYIHKKFSKNRTPTKSTNSLSIRHSETTETTVLQANTPELTSESSKSAMEILENFSQHYNTPQKSASHSGTPEKSASHSETPETSTYKTKTAKTTPNTKSPKSSNKKIVTPIKFPSQDELVSGPPKSKNPDLQYIYKSFFHDRCGESHTRYDVCREAPNHRVCGKRHSYFTECDGSWMTLGKFEEIAMKWPSLKTRKRSQELKMIINDEDMMAVGIIPQTDYETDYGPPKSARPEIQYVYEMFYHFKCGQSHTRVDLCEAAPPHVVCGKRHSYARECSGAWMTVEKFEMLAIRWPTTKIKTQKRGGEEYITTISEVPRRKRIRYDSSSHSQPYNTMQKPYKEMSEDERKRNTCMDWNTGVCINCKFGNRKRHRCSMMLGDRICWGEHKEMEHEEEWTTWEENRMYRSASMEREGRRVVVKLKY